MHQKVNDIFKVWFIVFICIASAVLYADRTYPEARGKVLGSDNKSIVISPIGGYIANRSDIGEGEGKIGLQRYYNEHLVAGTDLYTAIDTSLQSETENILDEMKVELNATEIMAMIMDSKSGELVTIASSNRYDPTHIMQKDIPSLRPGFTEYLFEPGSVMMPFIISMSLNGELINRHKDKELVNTNFDKFYIDNGIWIKDDVKHKTQTMLDILINSSNIGVAQIALKIPNNIFHYALTNYGFGIKSGIDLSRELKGLLKSEIHFEKRLYKANTANGYGIMVTPIQLLKAYSMFANEGWIVTPHIAKIQEIEKKEVIARPIAQKVKYMLMENVKRGTAQKAQLEGITIGGKTGTAQIAKEGKYTNKYNSSFYGFAEDEQGRSYTIGVLVVNAKAEGKHFASQSAVPVFRNIIENMIESDLIIPKYSNSDHIKDQKILLKSASTKVYAPLIGAKVIKAFGKFRDPVYHINVYNESVTLQASNDNNKVISVMAGKVVFSGKTKTLGNVVIIAHNNDLLTVFAGLRNIAFSVQKGKWIGGAYVIGRVENNLIFQVVQDGKPIDPMNLLEVGKL